MGAQESGRRIVSKGAYAKAKAKRESIRFMGICLLLSAGALGLIAVAMLFVENAYAFVFCICLIALTHFIGKWGYESINRAREINPGIPFTRANIANLPAPDSLVRASAEPVQVQESVLLRAAVGTQVEQKEQLLRTVVDEQEPA